MAKTILYYKVKNKSDTIKCAALINGHFIMEPGDLYTPTEINKALHKKNVTQDFIDKHFTRIELNPAFVYKGLQGARFESIKNTTS